MFELFGICAHVAIVSIVFYPMYLGAQEDISRLVKRNKRR